MSQTREAISIVAAMVLVILALVLVNSAMTSHPLKPECLNYHTLELVQECQK